MDKENIIINLINLSFGPINISLGNWTCRIEITDRECTYINKKLVQNILQYPIINKYLYNSRILIPRSYFNYLRNEYREQLYL